MKKINEKVTSFLGEIILKYKLEKNIIDDSFDYSDKSSPLEKAHNLFFNKKTSKRIKDGENFRDFNPFIKLFSIVNDIINNSIDYNSLPALIEEKLCVSKEDAKEISLLIERNEDIKSLREEVDINPINEEKIEKRSIGYELLK